MRQLLRIEAVQESAPAAGPVTNDDLARIYAFPERPWLRVNFVASLDGAATGSNGRSGTLNNELDEQVFALQRRLCDVVIVGAQTAKIEGYQRIEDERDQVPLLVVVSSSGQVPDGIVGHRDGRGPVVLVTSESAGERALQRAKAALGEDAVWVVGETEVDLAALRERLVSVGRPRMLCEGGPTLYAAMLTAGVVDEMALTWVPLIVTGAHPRITTGMADLHVDLQLVSLIEDAGTLLGLWRIVR